MADIDYAKLSRVQKLAVCLLVIGPEAAADLLRQFEDPEIGVLCREMGQFQMISDNVRQAALTEFTPLIGESIGSTLGGLDFAKKTLEIARGDYKASLMLN